MLLYATELSLSDEFKSDYKDTSDFDYSNFCDGLDKLVKVTECCEELIKDKGELSNQEYYDRFKKCVFIDPKSYDKDDIEGILWMADIDPSTIDLTKLNIDDFVKEDGKYFSYNVEYIRNKVSVKALKEILKKHLHSIEWEIELYTILSPVLNEDKDFDEFLEKYNRDFKDSGLEKRLSRLRKDYQ